LKRLKLHGRQTPQPSRRRAHRGTWFNRTKESSSACMRGKTIHSRQFATSDTVILSPMPCWEHLSESTVPRWAAFRQVCPLSVPWLLNPPARLRRSLDPDSSNILAALSGGAAVTVPLDNGDREELSSSRRAAFGAKMGGFSQLRGRQTPQTDQRENGGRKLLQFSHRFTWASPTLEPRRP
jgi:hypothetical protein